MAAPSTTKRESALANLKTALQAMTAGATYNYTPSLVVRTEVPFFELLDPSLTGDQLMYFLEEGLSTHERETIDGQWISEVEVFITAAKRYIPDHPHPAERTTEQESQVRGKLFGDVAVAALASHHRGMNAMDTQITHDAPVMDPDLELEGWVIHEFRLVISVQWDEDAP